MEAGAHKEVAFGLCAKLKAKYERVVVRWLGSPSGLTVASGGSFELGLEGQQSHVPHQPGFGDHQG